MRSRIVVVLSAATMALLAVLLVGVITASGAPKVSTDKGRRLAGPLWGGKRFLKPLDGGRVGGQISLRAAILRAGVVRSVAIGQPCRPWENRKLGLAVPDPDDFPPGPAGPKGDTGAAGAKGATGAAGATGSPGATGASGSKGDTGAKGATGRLALLEQMGLRSHRAVGPQGPKGEIGPQGVQGPKGETGAQGAWATRPEGDTGAQADWP
jgi:hypothetical protein